MTAKYRVIVVMEIEAKSQESAAAKTKFAINDPNIPTPFYVYGMNEETAYETSTIDLDQRDEMRMTALDALADGLSVIEDIDEACRVVQDHFGQTDGGLAGIMMDPDEWAKGNQARRRQMIRNYITVESAHAQGG